MPFIDSAQLLKRSDSFIRRSLLVFIFFVSVLMVIILDFWGLSKGFVNRNARDIQQYRAAVQLHDDIQKAHFEAILALEHDDPASFANAHRRLVSAIQELQQLPERRILDKERLVGELDALAASMAEVSAYLETLDEMVPESLHEAVMVKMESVSAVFDEAQLAALKNVEKDASELSGHVSHFGWSIMVLAGLIAVLAAVLGRFYGFREKAVQSLRKSEERYRLIAQNVTDYIWVRDLGLNVIYASPAITQQLGYTVDEAMKLKPRDVLTEESYEKIMSVLREERELEERGDAAPDRIRTVLLNQVRKDGSLFWSESRIRFTRNDEGKPTGLIGVTRDITSRKEAEDRLRKLSHAVEQSPVSVVVTDLVGSIEYVNPKFCELTGYTYEECIGQNPRILKSGLTSPDVYEDFWSTIGNGGTWKGEFCNLKKDGSLYWEDVTASAIRDSSGRITHYIAVKEDITRRKETEEKLRRSEELFRSIINLTSEGFWISDAQFRAIDVNDSLCRMLGYEREEMIGKTPFDFADEENLKIFREHTAKAATELNRTYEIALRAKSGENVHTIIHATTKMGADGQPENIFAFITDVRELKRMEHDLRTSLEDREILIREVYHRTKNNLMVIQSLLSLHSRRLEEGESKAALTASTDRVRAMSMIHEMLYRTDDLKRINVADYIGRLAAQLFRSYRISRNVRLDIDVASIPMDVDTVIPCGLIVNELVSNSLKHAFPDDRGGKLGVYLHYYADHGYVLTVCDEGVGLPADFPPERGSSLGMQIVSSLVEQLNGNLDFSSGQEGAEFRVTFTEREV